MNILTIAQDVAAIVGTEQPETLFNKTNTQSILFLSLLRDAFESVRRYANWSQTMRTGSFYILDGQTIYPLNEICEDFFSLVADTVYIQDAGKKVIGSVSPESYMRTKSFKNNPLGECFYFRNNAFHFIHLPPVGSKIIFQYQTKNIVSEPELKNGERIYRSELLKDTDIPVFDAYLIKLGLIWRWYKRNGMPYDEEYQEYIKELKKAYSADRMIENISLLGSGVGDFWGGLNNLGGVHVISQKTA